MEDPGAFPGQEQWTNSLLLEGVWECGVPERPGAYNTGVRVRLVLSAGSLFWIGSQGAAGAAVGVCPVQGLHSSAFCRWCCLMVSSDRDLQPATRREDEAQKLWVWGHGPLLENGGSLPSGSSGDGVKWHCTGSLRWNRSWAKRWGFWFTGKFML